MLYPKNKTEKLDATLFQNPTSEYRGVPFWSWNTKVTDALVTEQIEQFHQMGMGGAMIHARTGLDTAYMGDEFMRLVALAHDEMKQRGMLTWLYDEDRYPSGSAGGAVTKNYRYRARHIYLSPSVLPNMSSDCTAYFAALDAGKTPDGYYVTSYRIILEDGCLKDYTQVDIHEAGAWHAYVRTMEASPWYNGQTYIDTLNKSAVETFIRLTHEKYYDKLKHDFGTNIPAIFTDEPQMQAKRTLAFAGASNNVSTVWTDDLEETYQAQYHTSLIEKLPEIFWQLPGGKMSQARYQFHDHVTERFAAAFSDTIGAWCADHGIMFTGHLMSERLLLGQTLAVGEAMRHYRAYQLPGVDVLVGQLELSTIKQAASVAAQDGREGVISELYGVTEWDADFKTYKLQGDWQMALGVTVRNLHLQFMSMEGESKRDWPASIGYQSPWWKHFKYIEDYFARTASVLTRGQAQVNIAVIHPIESYWLHYGPGDQTSRMRDSMEENFENVLQWMLYGLMDFHFISESLLPSQCPAASAPLKVGQMQYDVIIVPDCITLRSTTLKRLRAFADDGGKLIFLGKVPTHIGAVPSEQVLQLAERAQVVPYSRYELLNSLSDYRIIDIKQKNGKSADNLFYNLRKDESNHWLFISHVKRKTNLVGTIEKYQVRIKGCWQLMQYDAISGDVDAVQAQHHGDWTCFEWACYAEDALLLNMQPCASDDAVICGANTTDLSKTEPLLETTPTIFTKPNAYILEEPNALLLDRPAWRIDDGAWQPEEEILRVDNLIRAKLGIARRQDKIVQPWLICETEPKHRVSLQYTFTSDAVRDGIKLAIERSEKAQIVLNGTIISSIADGWYVDRSIHTVPLPQVQQGINHLEVILPFTERTNLEVLYLLGDFGVGEDLNTLVDAPKSVGLFDLTRQHLPFYTGNVVYRIIIEASKEGDVLIQVPHYRGAAMEVSLDGVCQGMIAYAPHKLLVKNVAKGIHTLDINLLGNRFNGFGTLHNANSNYMWYGPDSYRTAGDEFSESYLIRPFGILSRVEIYGL